LSTDQGQGKSAAPLAHGEAGGAAAPRMRTPVFQREPRNGFGGGGIVRTISFGFSADHLVGEIAQAMGLGEVFDAAEVYRRNMATR
ncbi:MAG TPA: hypothetical protein PK648_15035, partial [Verrucomicrobiales bacterium]|nr:hypothetical protein [Verrucomicrobiales bacterium]